MCNIVIKFILFVLSISSYISSENQLSKHNAVFHILKHLKLPLFWLHLHAAYMIKLWIFEEHYKYISAKS